LHRGTKYSSREVPSNMIK